MQPAENEKHVLITMRSVTVQSGSEQSVRCAPQVSRMLIFFKFFTLGHLTKGTDGCSVCRNHSGAEMFTHFGVDLVF